jgi:hypothetical protein
MISSTCRQNRTQAANCLNQRRKRLNPILRCLNQRLSQASAAGEAAERVEACDAAEQVADEALLFAA